VLARIAGVAIPLHDAGIAIFSALYGRNFRAGDGRMVACHNPR
jgi:hypothetical protein